MGIPRPKDLSDLIRLEAHLRVTCSACGRSGVFPVRDVIAYFRSHNWNSAWTVAGERFRCDGTPESPGCGHRGAHLSLTPIEGPPVAPVPQPTLRDLKVQRRRERS